jgi:geranylgeranyl diphosphate synthase type II
MDSHAKALAPIKERGEKAMSVQLAEFLKLYGPRLEEAFLHWLPLSDKPGTERFNKAVYYAVFPGGKRMRPLFTLIAADTVGGDPEQALPVACAIEYLHTCSLIFDDLPAMDNAGERRGRRPTHRVFGEDVAMLAALALFNQGYALIGQINHSEKVNSDFQRLMSEMATSIGPNGMIAGQIVDLRLGVNDNKRLRPVSYLKTTALMRLMLTTGAIVAGADDGQIKALAAFGENLGKVYQMLDDIVDEVEDYSATPLPEIGIDVTAVWQKANKELKVACNRVLEDLGDKNPALLIEFADKIFTKIKKQAASRLAIEKWHWEPVSKEARSLKTE